MVSLSLMKPCNLSAIVCACQRFIRKRYGAESRVPNTRHGRQEEGTLQNNYLHSKLIELKTCCPISGLTKEMTTEWGGRKKRGTVWSVVNPTKMGQWHPFE